MQTLITHVLNAIMLVCTSHLLRFHLTRILPLYVMIVKLRQNFTKMREFSWIRDQKKNYAKNIYRLRDMTMFPNGNIGGFRHKLLKSS